MMRGIIVALSTPDGSWAQRVKAKRKYNHSAQRSVVATVMLDMLRRHLDGKAVIGRYESLVSEGDAFLPAER